MTHSTSRYVAYGLLGVAAISPSALLRGCAPPPKPAAVANTDCVQAVNAERANAGLGGVSANGALTNAAMNHSADQAARNKMSHTGGNGSNPGTRIAAAGYSASVWAENVAAGFADCASVMRAWMNSSGHRANILNGSVTEIGIGSATAANGMRYWTMVLASQ
jgi:uncharacterized protein YkwD